MMGREFDPEEAEPHIRNKGWSPEFQTPRRKQKRREDAHAPRKSPIAGRNGASVNGILHVRGGASSCRASRRIRGAGE